ncbi:MAG: SusC/RagA family TonB-linked outer membrane protein [Flavitalea sp.]
MNCTLTAARLTVYHDRPLLGKTLFKFFMRMSVAMLALLVSSIQLLNASPIKGKAVSPVKAELKNESLVQAFQQVNPNIVVKGKVTNEKGEPLVGVSVTLKGKTSGTSTDETGAYSLNVPGEGTLVFTYVDFATQEIEVNGKETIDVVLSQTDKALSTVIVTALGITRSVKSLTYAAQNIKGSEMNEAKETNVINSLQGRVAGLTITKNATGPGGESKVLLRGNRSLSGNSDPLYVIDGVPLAGGIEMLNPDDIESMTVLKGASAAALYGSQGQNGAIIISTRRARSGAINVEYNGGVSLDQASILPKLQYKYGQGDAGIYVASSEHSWGPKADGQQVTLWNGESVPLTGQPDRLKDFFRTATTLTNSISLSGGTEKMQAFFSYGNTHAEGIMRNNNLDRHNIDLKVGYNVNSKLSINTKLTYIYEDVKNRVTPGEGGTYALPSIFRSPTSIPANEMKKYSYVDENGNEKQSYWKPGSSILENPYWALNRVSFYQQKDRILGLFVAKYEFTDWLNLQVRGSIDKTLRQTDNKVWSDNYFSLVGSDYNYDTYRDQSTNVDVLLSFNHKLSKRFDLSGNIGGASQQGNFYSQLNAANGLNKSNFFYMSNAKNPFITDKDGKNPQVLSVYATATLKYNNYLYLDVTGRNDWSTALPKNNKSYFYPSIGLAGIISEMVKLPSWISYGKARITFANSGYGGLEYLDQNYYQVGIGGSIIAPTVRSFSEYKPELTSSFEAGLEWQFFNDRVGFEATYYDTKSKNQLLLINVPEPSTFTQRYINAGLIRNTGFELMVHGTPVRSKDFSWNVSLNFSTNKNKVESLLPTVKSVVLEDDREAQIRAAVGGSYGDMYVKDWMKDSVSGKHLVDDNGKPILTDGNTVFLGNYNPKYMMGLSNSFTFKDFSLSFLIDYRNGGYIIAGTQALLDADGHSATSLQGREGGLVLDAVTESGAKNTTSITSQAYYSAIGDRYPTGMLYAYSATNMRLRELTLGYRLPRRLFEASKFVRDVKFSLVGRNLFFFKRDAPIDPEITNGLTGGGLEYGALPSTRNYGVNIKVSF